MWSLWYCYRSCIFISQYVHKWLERVLRTDLCERKRERKMNIVKQKRRRNTSFICLCQLEDTGNKSYGIITLLFGLVVGWLIGFYGISTFVGYLMPNPFLYKYSVLFQTIQFSMSTQFNYQKHFYFKLFNLFKQFNSANSV